MAYPMGQCMGYLTGHRMGIQWYIPRDTPWDSRGDFPCPALTPGSYICGLLLFSCLVLDGLTSFNVFSDIRSHCGSSPGDMTEVMKQ